MNRLMTQEARFVRDELARLAQEYRDRAISDPEWYDRHAGAAEAYQIAADFVDSRLIGAAS